MKLNVVVDMFGCSNRCMHCWLGHMPNRKMEEGADRFIMDYFDPFFDQIAFYSWLREPDYCEDYAERWAKDLAISKNTLPERFELAQGLRKNNYPALEFFVHEGSCEGENQKLYPIRIQKSHISPARKKSFLWMTSRCI